MTAIDTDGRLLVKNDASIGDEEMIRRLRIIGITCVIFLAGCNSEQELYSTKYNAYFSHLNQLNDEEYKQVALCEVSALLFNTGHFSSDYANGRVTITTLFGKISRTLPIRGDLGDKLRDLIRLDKEKGASGRFAESFTLLGTREIVCDKK